MSSSRIYDLSAELKEWLEFHKVEYTCRTQRVLKSHSTYLYHFIDIPDPNKAMLYKLTWV